MSEIQKISISLPKEMAATLKQVVATGAYASSSEIMREAFRDWQEKQVRKQQQLEKLRQMIQDGFDSGPGVPLDAEAIKRRCRERLAATK
jgi:antitoxin ParD1/3/4